jgi:DNA-binding NarL/FixJ family response regulator
LLQAIREVTRGYSYFSPVIVQRLRRQARDLLGGQTRAARNRELTRRETQVLKFVAEGVPNKSIALKLGLSIKTVEKHRQMVMNKLDLHDIASLTRYAASKGMITVPTMQPLTGGYRSAPPPSYEYRPPARATVEAGV